MKEVRKHAGVFGRTIVGAIAGSVMGFFAELGLLVFLWGQPAGEAKFPIGGPLIGAGLGGVFGLVFGGNEIRGVARRVAVSIAIGTILGALAGYFAYAPIMTSNDPFADDLFRGRVLARYQQIGVLWGAPLGACGGLMVAIVTYLFPTNRRSRTESGPTA